MKSESFSNKDSACTSVAKRLTKLKGILKVKEIDFPIDYFLTNTILDKDLDSVLTQNESRNNTANFFTNHVKIVNYLQSNHKYYLDNAIPSLSLTFYRAMENSGNDIQTIELCYKIFDGYTKALAAHIIEEESYFNSLLKEDRKFNEVIRFFSKHHENEFAALEEIMKLIKELTDHKSFSPVNILFSQLQSFTSDLKIHHFVEEKLLLPALIELAKKSSTSGL